MIPPNVIVDHEYHIVELHTIQPPDEVFEWLKNNCKEHWTYRHPNIYFASSKDHLMFTLSFS